MIQLVTTQEVDEKDGLEAARLPVESSSIEQLIASSCATQNPTTQLLLSRHLSVHTKDAGLNPLVDAAAKLFSVMGKLKYIKSHDDLGSLHQELVTDIQHFQETVKNYSYSEEYAAEYLPIATYTLCATLDDIISETLWGNQVKWEPYSLLASFDQERLSNQNFLIILERFVRDPAIYIDIMEFIYICLSLGFRCHFTSNEGDHEQLQQITYSLYKRIRAHRGNFSKALAPFPIKPKAFNSSFSWKSMPIWLMGLFVTSLLLLLFIVGKYLLHQTVTSTNRTTPQTEWVLNEKHHE